MPFTDAQLVLLSAASQRHDGLLPRPQRIGGTVLARMEAALVRSGAAEAVPVRADQPCWRMDEAEAPVGLRITPVGLAAIGVEPALDDSDAREGVLHAEEKPQPCGGPPSSPKVVATVRPGTKQARLVAMLADGAPVDALGAALSWQAHTVRAALTRLRQSGLTLTARKNEQNRTVYRIVPAAAASAPAESQPPVRPADAADGVA